VSNGPEASTPTRPERTPASILYVVKQLELVIRARLDAVLRPSGVTALQYTALSVLERRPTISSSDLARSSFVRAQSTHDLVSALTKRGLIERSVDPANRRRLLISLTGPATRSWRSTTRWSPRSRTRCCASSAPTSARRSAAS
jgi:DNA-binding MarR family transcriptional regulator